MRRRTGQEERWAESARERQSESEIDRQREQETEGERTGSIDKLIDR